ncbi:MAG: hypothetical protein ABIH58_05380 [Patescibacteria group bacterium]
MPELAVQPVSQYRLSQVKDNLFIAVEPFYDKEKIEEYFGRDLLSDGILPILLVAENHNQTSSFVLLKEQFSLTEPSSDMIASSDAGAPIAKEASIQAGASMAASTGMAVLTFNPMMMAGGVIVGGKAVADASAIQHNLTTKELTTKTLSHGKSQYGFVYFKLKDKNGITGNYIADVKALNLQSGEVLTFSFPLRQGGK